MSINRSKTMVVIRLLSVCGVVCGAFALRPPETIAQSPNPSGPPREARADSSPRDRQHDFDFHIGTWKTHLKRLMGPLSGSNTWVEYEGTTVVRSVWNGRANLVELAVDGPAGHIEGLSLRLYNPESHQWSLNFANAASGTLAEPTVGEFKNGRGEFFDQETFNGRAILVRFVISEITPTSCHFEQAFSDDGGKTWEVNWVATDTRVNEAPRVSGETVLPPDLTQAVGEYYEAQLRNDVAKLDELVADDYVLVNSDGTVEDKRQAVADHERPGFKIDSYVVEQPIEKVWSDSALTGGVVNLRWTQDGKHQTRLIRIVNVWARRDGRWQVTYTQVSRLPQPG
jgi:hypothetical protein